MTESQIILNLEPGNNSKRAAKRGHSPRLVLSSGLFFLAVFAFRFDVALFVFLSQFFRFLGDRPKKLLLGQREKFVIFDSRIGERIID